MLSSETQDFLKILKLEYKCSQHIYVKDINDSSIIIKGDDYCSNCKIIQNMILNLDTFVYTLPIQCKTIFKNHYKSVPGFFFYLTFLEEKWQIINENKFITNKITFTGLTYEDVFWLSWGNKSVHDLNKFSNHIFIKTYDSFFDNKQMHYCCSMDKSTKIIFVDTILSTKYKSEKLFVEKKEAESNIEILIFCQKKFEIIPDIFRLNKSLIDIWSMFKEKNKLHILFSLFSGFNPKRLF